MSVLKICRSGNSLGESGSIQELVFQDALEILSVQPRFLMFDIEHPSCHSALMVCWCRQVMAQTV